jgi:hypothetical protein
MARNLVARQSPDPSPVKTGELEPRKLHAGVQFRLLGKGGPKLAVKKAEEQISVTPFFFITMISFTRWI